MSIILPGSPIPCCADVHPSILEKIRYALRMLLVPLGLDPDWVEPHEVSRGLYYGAAAEPESAVRLQASSDARSLFENGRSYDARQTTWFDVDETNVPALFGTPAGEPDIVASTFIWLSGWQEASSDRDEHGRVPFASSLPAQLDVPGRPVVDEYREMLARQLREAGIPVNARRWSGHDWAFCPTHDIDYLRKWRPGIIYREFVQNLLLNRLDRPVGGRLQRAAAAVRQMRGEDPYRAALHEMPDRVRRTGGTATYFIKSGAGDPHDVPYALDDTHLAERLHELAHQDFEIGLHPSYATPKNQSLMAEEKKRLECAAGRPIRSVRQHYLRYDPVQTAQIHDALGFQIDSTLGFAEQEGFRRATCLPFQLYDLEHDQPLSTWEMPLAVMESSLFNRRGLGVADALRVVEDLVDTCRRHGGALVALWHNTLGDELECPGWQEHFEATLDHAREKNAHIASLGSALAGWK